MSALLMSMAASVWLAAPEAAESPADAITPPKLVQFFAAEYPAQAMAEGRQAAVVLALDIDEAGAVTDVQVAESAGAEFDAAAVAAAKKFVFEPARKGDTPISVRILYRYAFTIELQPSKEPVINFQGMVYGRWTKQPLKGVTVTIVGIDGASAVTDGDGRFAFADIPVGEHQVRFEGQGLIGIQTEQKIEKDRRVDLKIAMEPLDEGLDEVDEEEVVRASRIKKEVIETRIEAKEARKVPGTQGDTVKVVETMGGVTRSAAGSGNLVVWGASPSDTRAYVDGVLVPRLFHIGGGRSILASDFVSSVDLVPGGFGADYGRAIGGLIRVETRRPTEGGVHGYGAVDPIDASAGVRTQLGKSTWLAAGGRRSLLNQTFDVFFDERARELVPVPDYWDYQAKLLHRAQPNDTYEVTVFGASDHVTRGSVTDDPRARFREETSSSFHRVSASLERVGSDGVTVRITPWVGIDQQDTQMRFGDVPAGLEKTTYRAALLLSERRRLASWVVLRSGLDLELAQTDVDRSGALSLPAREGDITIFGQPPGNRVNRDRWGVFSGGASAYAAAEVSLLSDAVQLEPGLRFEPHIIDGDRVLPVRPSEPAVGYTELQLALDPRLKATWKLLPWLALNAAGGRYHQPADPADLSPVFGRPILDMAEALHALGGFRLDPLESTSVELTAFWVKQSHLAVRSPSPTPAIARALVADGEGRNVGAQVTVRHRASENLYGWLTYSLMRAERRDHADEDWRLFDSDQTHSLQAVASWNAGGGFELGGRFRLTSGFPRTPVVGTYYNATADIYEPVFGEQNSFRIPAFLELSLRVGWRHEAQWGVIEAFLDVQNVTNHRNAEEIIYTSDYSEREYITGLPVLPVLGVRIEL